MPYEFGDSRHNLAEFSESDHQDVEEKVTAGLATIQT
jgi:hypothetical protein